MTRLLLLASFVDKEELYDALDSISSAINIDRSKIFVFINEDNPDEYILTYNLNSELANIKFTSIWKNTISIHRKKNTNTLYSLNAMNKLIKKFNNGVMNQSYKLNWSEYQNSFLIIKGGNVVIIPLRLVKINH